MTGAERGRRKADKTRRRKDLERRTAERLAKERSEQKAKKIVELSEEAGVDINLDKIKDPHTRRAVVALPAIDAALQFLNLSNLPAGVRLRGFGGAAVLIRELFPIRQDAADMAVYRPKGAWSQAYVTCDAPPTYYPMVVRTRSLPLSEYWRLLGAEAQVRGKPGLVEETSYLVARGDDRLDYGQAFFKLRDGGRKAHILLPHGPVDHPQFGQRITTGGVIQTLQGPAGMVHPDLVVMGPVASYIHAYMRNSWQIEVAGEGAMSIRLPADSSAIRHMFCHRDPPPGKTRRQALLNWVCRHWRTDRRVPEDEIYVRRHLRGGRTFDWFGFTCSIIAPTADAENVELAAARSAMPADRTRRSKAALTGGTTMANEPKAETKWAQPSWLTDRPEDPEPSGRPTAAQLADMTASLIGYLEWAVLRACRAAGVTPLPKDRESIGRSAEETGGELALAAQNVGLAEEHRQVLARLQALRQELGLPPLIVTDAA